MAKHLQRDLDNLQKDMLALAGLVEEAVHKAIHALQKRDVDLAREVIDGDGRIDNEENHIDEECLKILALHQPVAVDLRLIAAAMLINVDLERIGDLAEEIAERAIHLAQPPLLPIPERLQHMTDLTTMMLRQALDSYVNLNKSQAQAVMRMDDEVDRFNAEIIHETVGADEEVARFDRGRPVDVLGRAPHGADRRPRHQHRRGRDLPDRRGDRAPPAAGRPNRGSLIS